MSLEYTNISHESLLADWNNRVLADERYKNLSKASIYSYLQEFIAGVLDLTNFYIQRTAEENYLDTAKLDSSSIKLSHNLGYQPKRAIPATGNVTLELRGPLPANLKATHKSLFDGTLQGVERTDAPAFSFQGHPEASPGPHDPMALFKHFVELMRKYREKA